MATFTLHQGEAKQEFTEHPVETARRALTEAARMEYESGTADGIAWASLMSRVASSLPNRPPIVKGGE